MSRLSGFVVGFMIALTAVLTMSQSMSQRLPVQRQSISLDSKDPASDIVASKNMTMSTMGEPANEDAAHAMAAFGDAHLAETEASVENPSAAEPDPAPPAANDLPPTRVQVPAAPNTALVADPGTGQESESTAQSETANPQWHAFWQPFSSEISARGFRTRLERITGLDYRVMKVDSGQYHVAFSYDDEQSRVRHLAAIEQATGLSLGGESF